MTTTTIQKEWQSLKREFAVTGRTLRDTMQKMLVFGVMRVIEDGNANYLTEAVKLGHAADYSDRKLIDFIITHCPALTWTDGRFKKDKESESELSESKVPTMKWWKFKKAPLVQDLDFDKAVVSLVKRVSKAKREGKFVSTGKYDAVLEALEKVA